MKTFSEVMDTITPSMITNTSAEYKDELMANEKFLTLISLMGAAAVEGLTTSLTDLHANKNKPLEAKRAAEDISLTMLSCLSTAFSVGMAVGMKMMGERRVQ